MSASINILWPTSFGFCIELSLLLKFWCIPDNLNGFIIPFLVVLQFPASSSDFTLFSLDLDSHKEFNIALKDILQGESSEQSSRYYNPSF